MNHKPIDLPVHQFTEMDDPLAVQDLHKKTSTILLLNPGIKPMFFKFRSKYVND